MCDADVVKVFNCTRCDYESRDFWRLLRHYQLVHGNEAGFHVQCGVENCFKSYNSVKALCAHMRAKHETYHKQQLLQRARNIDLPEGDLTVNVSDECNAYLVNFDGTAECDGSPRPTECNKSDETLASNHVAAMSLKLREINRVSGNVCEDIRENVSVMLSASREHMKGNVLSKLSDLGASLSLCTAVSEVFASQSPYEKALDFLSKEYHVNKFVEQNFPFVQPIEYILKNLNPDDDTVERMQYVPLLDMLKVLLNDDVIFSYVMNSHQSTDNKMRDFCDGKFFKQHPLFATDEYALQIVLYYDDFGAVNPLGHRAKKYKISAFYFTLANVPPKDRSRLHTIFLSAVCFASALRRCGFDEVMRPLVEDLITVAEKGVSVERDGQLFTIKGALVAVVADNLAAHGIGGFFESFTSVYPCRFCLLRKNNLKLQFVSCSNLRTQETYQRQLERISKFDRLQSVYGLKRNSCLNRIPNFHVVSGLPSDIMHDLLEGVACDILECIIKYCISAGFITINSLNCQIEQFPYKGSDKVNRPDPVISEPIRCRQTAAKCRCLLRLLPLMIGCRVPVGDRKWEVLLALLWVHDLAFSLAMSKVDTMLLDDAVEAFLMAFTTEFVTENVKPKMHFMVHYGDHCRMFGPLIQYWSFRFEGKHGYFKDLACRLKCRKNVLLTLARKHQYYQSWHLQNNAFLSRDDISSISGQQVTVSQLPLHVKSALLPVIGNHSNVFQATSVSIDGIHFECGMAVITGVNNCDLTFSVIDSLFLVDRHAYIFGNKLANVEYCRHLHAYVGIHSESHHVISVAHVIDPFPLPVYLLHDGQVCIVLKHNISFGV